MRPSMGQVIGLAIVILWAAGNGEAGDISIIQGDQGTTGIIYDSGGIQRYQFNSPTGDVQSGTLYRFGSPPGSGPTLVIPILPGPPMRIAPLVPVIPVVPVLPNAGLTPTVPTIGVITPGPAPGTSTWGSGRR